MAKLDPKQEVIQLRSRIAQTAGLNLELQAKLSALFREHDIQLTNSTLQDMVFVHPSEFAPTAGNPIDVPPHPALDAKKAGRRIAQATA